MEPHPALLLAQVMELYTTVYEGSCRTHKDTIRNDPDLAAKSRERIRGRVVRALNLGDHPQGVSIQEVMNRAQLQTTPPTPSMTWGVQGVPHAHQSLRPSTACPTVTLVGGTIDLGPTQPDAALSMQVVATRKRLMIVTRYPECATATIRDHFLLEYAQEQGGLSEDFARRLVPQLLAFARSAAAHPTISARDHPVAQELVESYDEMCRMLLRSKLLVAEGADGPDPAGAVLKIGLLDDIPMRPRTCGQSCSFFPPEMRPRSHREPLMGLLYYPPGYSSCISPPELADMLSEVSRGEAFWFSPVRSRAVAPPAA